MITDSFILVLKGFFILQELVQKIGFNFFSPFAQALSKNKP